VCLADGTTIFAPLSIGLAVYPLRPQRHGAAPAADAAMYGAKRQSGATWHSAESAPPEPSQGADHESAQQTRRAFLLTTLAGLGALALSGCASPRLS
jgi:hypothetical protein